MAYEHTLSHLRQARQFFDDDRPVLKDHNAQPESRLNAFLTEVNELNGADKEKGFFGYEAVRNFPERLTDYRQQEVADIMLIGLSLPELFGFDIDEAAVITSANFFADLLNIPVVPEEAPLKAVGVFTEAQNDVYDLLKNLLNAAVEKIKDNPTLLHTPDEAKAILERVLTFCYVIFYLIGLPPVKACTEKIARNMLKYLAADYQPGPESYRDREKRSKDSFDGPVDSVLGQRPQTGTIEFYSFYEQEAVRADVDGQAGELHLVPALSPSVVAAMITEAETAVHAASQPSLESILVA